MTDKLYMSGNEYQANTSEGAAEFARSMVAEHGSDCTISATYNGKPCYVSGGQTYVKAGRMPGADANGFDWVSRLKK